jgi:hypothetical protein
MKKPKLQINIRDIVGDINHGLTDDQLMEKYGLSPRGLHSAMQKLAARDLLPHQDLNLQTPSFADTVLFTEARRIPRNYPAVAVSVFDGRNLGKAGIVRDLTEEGLGVRGLDGRLNGLQTLLIHSGTSAEVNPIAFHARCRWVKPGFTESESAAGYVITHISEENARELRRLIKLLTFRFDS